MHIKVKVQVCISKKEPWYVIFYIINFTSKICKCERTKCKCYQQYPLLPLHSTCKLNTGLLYKLWKALLLLVTE